MTTLFKLMFALLICFSARADEDKPKISAFAALYDSELPDDGRSDERVIDETSLEEKKGNICLQTANEQLRALVSDSEVHALLVELAKKTHAQGAKLVWRVAPAWFGNNDANLVLESYSIVQVFKPSSGSSIGRETGNQYAYSYEYQVGKSHILTVDKDTWSGLMKKHHCEFDKKIILPLLRKVVGDKSSEAKAGSNNNPEHSDSAK